MQTIERLITHSGAFHADEVLAYVVLRDLFPEAALTRTRNTALLDAAGEESIMFDVGLVFDPARGRFDHHQIGAPLRPDGICYSSFGLIWAQYGRDWLGMMLDEEHEIEGAWERLDRGMVRDIDALDTSTLQPGQEGANHPLSLPSLLMQFRPAWDHASHEEMTRGFLAAANCAAQILQASALSAAARSRADHLATELIANRPHRNWIELPCGMPWHHALRASGDEEILFAITPAEGQWYIDTVPVRPGSYETRKSLPAHWSGLRDDALAEVTGVPDAVFCHKALFVGAAKTRAGALKLLEQALAYEPGETTL